MKLGIITPERKIAGDIRLAAVFRERFPDSARTLDIMPDIVRFLSESEFAGNRCRWCGTKDSHATGCRWVEIMGRL